MAAVLLVAGGGGAPAQAAAPTPEGYDVSWPQCPTSVGGFGLPMPPTTTQFVIIGLTLGLAFTENPCLGDQVAWVTANRKPAHGYTMATFPTAAQLSTYGTRGPWSSSTRAGRLSNVGYSEARHAVASMQRTGFAPPVVWIDVEPRPKQPWPTSSAAQQRENRYVIEGLMRGLREAGLSYGLYSFASAWTSITGSWRLPGVPAWYPVGTLDSPTEPTDRCLQRSFSDSRIHLVQWTDNTYDFNITCSWTFGALPVPASSLSNSTADFDGDWNNDVLARVGATGDLRLYRGTGTGGILAGVPVASGWQVFDALETPGDLTGDGALDVVARERSTGYLWLYPGDGRGGSLPRVRVGVGWQVMNAVVGPGDFSGDQRADLLARETATGYLWLYPGDGRGGWLPRVRVGVGWGVFDAIVGPGDLSGDGAGDVLARRTSTGELWLYRGDGHGGWLTPARIGTGWQGMSAVLGAGDLNGDRTADVVAKERSTGYLWLYPRSAIGTWLPRVRIGTGWSGIDAII
ncbi:MAG: FG-GAP-like repeat-containing protein [Actinomycetes bacterium]